MKKNDKYNTLEELVVYIKKYADVKNSFFIFDEQRVVGYGAWARTFIKISKKSLIFAYKALFFMILFLKANLQQK